MNNFTVAIVREPHSYFMQKDSHGCLVALREVNEISHYFGYHPNDCRYSIEIPTKYQAGGAMYNKRFIYLKGVE